MNIAVSDFWFTGTENPQIKKKSFIFLFQSWNGKNQSQSNDSSFKLFWFSRRLRITVTGNFFQSNLLPCFFLFCLAWNANRSRKDYLILQTQMYVKSPLYWNSASRHYKNYFSSCLTVFESFLEMDAHELLFELIIQILHFHPCACWNLTTTCFIKRI